MKAILKTIDPKKNLDYNKPFNSLENITIRRNLIPELRKALNRFRPSVNQLTKWLNSLHKLRRSQLKLKKSEKYNANLRRQHNNNRMQDVSIMFYCFSFFIY